MSKNIQLRIDDPCHENWDKMTPSEKGRFCGSCQKQVVDFTRMSDSQIATFFKKPSTGSVCGRFMSDQLNKDLEIPRKRIPWIKYFFQFALPAFLVSRSAAQGEVKMVKGDTIATCSKEPVKPGLVKSSATGSEKDVLIKGRVVDENNEALAGASVILKGSNVGVATDMKGEFQIKSNSIAPNTPIAVSYVGYETQELALSGNSGSVTIQLQPAVIAMMGVIIFKREIPEIPLISTLEEDPARKITAFPNPAASGSLIKLATKKLKEGEYTIRFINQGGQTVHTVQTRLGKNIPSMNIQLPFLKTGHYIISVENKSLVKSFTEKLIIQ